MLKLILRLNALSCLGFGVLFLINAPAVSGFVGSAPDWMIRGLGVFLVGNGAQLVWASIRSAPAVAEIRYFAVGDFAWVATSIALISAGLFITTSTGIVVSLAVAAMVGVFGALQWRLAGRNVGATE